MLRTAVVLAVCSALSLTATAHAQDAEDTERARALFAEALELSDAGDWSRAADRLRQALALRDTAPIRYNLAVVLAELGRVVEARDHLTQTESDELNPERREAAEELQRSVARRIGRLRVDVAAQDRDMLVTVDGEPWPDGESVDADPGIRVVRLLQGTDVLRTERVDVPEGGDAQVFLERPISTTLATVDREGTAADSIDLSPPPRSDDDGLIVGLAVSGAVVIATVAAVLIGFFLTEESQPQPSMGDFMPPVLRVRE